jgi:hypothetical protein
MVFPSDLLFISTNYFSWKSHMEDASRSKELYQIALEKEQAPFVVKKKSIWDNKNDETHGLIKMSISYDLWFHLQGIDDPLEAWVKLEFIFGKHIVI